MLANWLNGADWLRRRLGVRANSIRIVHGVCQLFFSLIKGNLPSYRISNSHVSILLDYRHGTINNIQKSGRR